MIEKINKLQHVLYFQKIQVDKNIFFKLNGDMFLFDGSFYIEN